MSQMTLRRTAVTAKRCLEMLATGARAAAAASARSRVELRGRDGVARANRTRDGADHVGHMATDHLQCQDRHDRDEHEHEPVFGQCLSSFL